jgi:hypothetical protein
MTILNGNGEFRTSGSRVARGFRGTPPRQWLQRVDSSFPGTWNPTRSSLASDAVHLACFWHSGGQFSFVLLKASLLASVVVHHRNFRHVLGQILVRIPGRLTIELPLFGKFPSSTNLRHHAERISSPAADIAQASKARIQSPRPWSPSEAKDAAH